MDLFFQGQNPHKIISGEGKCLLGGNQFWQEILVQHVGPRTNFTRSALLFSADLPVAISELGTDSGNQSGPLFSYIRGSSVNRC